MTRRRARMGSLLGVGLALVPIGCRCPGDGSERSVADEVGSLDLPYFFWQDRWAPEAGDKRFFDMPALMSAYGLDRLEALELQNHYRDLLLSDWRSSGRSLPAVEPDQTLDDLDYPTARKRASAFGTALDRVRSGELESGWSTEEARTSDLVIVFDLDETLFHELRGAERRLVLAPDCDEALLAARDLGSVLLFTAKPDEALMEILRDWTIETPEGVVLVKDFVDGVFANHHLILQRKNADAGNASTRTTPTKDLRPLEPTLEKVVLIDDNPTRVLQHRNLLFVPPWQSESETIEDPALAACFDHRLTRALEEVRDALEWARANSTSFGAAFLPYSYAGRLGTVELARTWFQGDWAKAVEFVRLHPEFLANRP